MVAKRGLPTDGNQFDEKHPNDETVLRLTLTIPEFRNSPRADNLDSPCALPWQNEGMTLESLTQASRETILATAARHGARNVRVFGSVARGEADDLSDLDLLVDLDPGRGLMDMGGLLMDLQAQLHTKVDVATERMLRRDIRERVLSEAVFL